MAGGAGVTKVRTDLAYFGVVTQVISATQFLCPGVAGLGDGALVTYAAYVLAKANGTVTAPHAEQPAVTAYVSRTGTITHVAYTVPVAAGDQILFLHPNISTLVAAAIGNATASTLGSLYGILGNPAVPLSDLQGLCYRGVVTAVPGANQFTIPALAGLGAQSFIDLSGANPYYAFVKTDAGGGGAAPQNEARAVTGYATLTGNFSANAFTVPVAAGDEVLIIHPFLAKMLNLAGLPPIVGNLAANWQAAEQNLVLIGADNVRYKLHSLMIDMNAIVGTLTIRMYSQVVGVERRVYQQAFTVAADGPGRWPVNGSVGIHEVLRVTCQSDNAADNGAVIGYDYLLEAM